MSQIGEEWMKSLKIGLVAMALVSGGYYVSAEEKCDGKCAASAAKCPVTEGLEKLPKLAYTVGDESLCCEESAKALAASSGKKLVYAVGKEKFECPTTAFKSLVEQTEKYVANFSTPSTCSVSGTTTVAVKAGEVAAKVKKAMDSVAISYKVGDKSCQCPVEAKTIAADKKLKTVFVVDKEETECEQTARLNLARAKYKAALLAMNPPAKTEEKTN
jgi:hypothetical protein